MKERLFSLLRHELIKGSAFIFIGNLLANFFNYIFHLMTGRLLGPEHYAIIASLISLSYVVSFPSTIINTVVTRKVAALYATKQYGQIKGIYMYLFQLVFFFTILLIILFYLLQKPIAEFLKIDDTFLVFLLGLSFALSLFATVNQSVIQGMLLFLRYSLLSTGYSVLRDILALCAILLGFGVLGVMWGLVLNAALIVILSFIALSTIWGYKAVRKKIHLRSYTSLFWIAPALFGMSLMLNGDVILVKHFFPAYEAGLYGALTTMGKVIFFASSAITTVLLPVAVKKHESGEPVTPILLQASGLSFVLSIIVVAFYFVFPDFSVKFFYGDRYIGMKDYIGLYGIYFLLYNFCYIFVYFYVSLRRNVILLAPFFIGILQLLFIFIFHRTIPEVILVVNLTAALLLIIFLLYYILYEKKFKKNSLNHRTLL